MREDDEVLGVRADLAGFDVARMKPNPAADAALAFARAALGDLRPLRYVEEILKMKTRREVAEYAASIPAHLKATVRHYLTDALAQRRGAGHHDQQPNAGGT